MIKEGVLIGDRYEIMGRIGTGGDGGLSIRGEIIS